MHLINNGFLKFDYQFPIYNFFFPNQTYKSIPGDKESLEKILITANEFAISRALYFHIPFCEKICTFCPFTKGLYKNQESIDQYVVALIKEIEYKAQLINYKDVPITAIFFGGGTPSLLSPKNIYDIGEAIHKHFDLTCLKEFSFEMHITSISQEVVTAIKDIGATHARFGFQTIDPTWRKLFNLDPSTELIDRAAELLVPNIEYVLCDILYGMNGQEEDMILRDIDKADSLGINNIDIYPINNIVTSSKLHRSIKDYTANITSATRKMSMRILADLHLRQKGFMPHNGHGYVKTDVTDKIVTDKYSFIYHEHVYGYSNYDLLGFGVNAISSVRGHIITNTAAREQYISTMSNGNYRCKVSQHDTLLDDMKPLILRLAYHGYVEKNKISSTIVPNLLNKIKNLIKSGLVVEDEISYQLTKQGWYWYTNIMFYLMPEQEQLILKKIVHEELDKPGRFVSKKELIYSTQLA